MEFSGSQSKNLGKTTKAFRACQVQIVQQNIQVALSRLTSLVQLLPRVLKTKLRMVVADNNEDDDEDGVGILQAHVCNDLIRALPPRGRGCSPSQ